MIVATKVAIPSKRLQSFRRTGSVLGLNEQERGSHPICITTPIGPNIGALSDASLEGMAEFPGLLRAVEKPHVCGLTEDVPLDRFHHDCAGLERVGPRLNSNRRV
jgi:hypothetical protein